MVTASWWAVTNLVALLRSRRVLRVGSAGAGSVTGVPGRPLGVRCLHDGVDRPLGGVHVIQPVVGADRVGVRGRAGAHPRTGKRNAGSARTTSDLAGESRRSGQTGKQR